MSTSSIPHSNRTKTDRGGERFERIAARHGMNRSEFYRLAGQKFATELEGEAELTTLANATVARAGQPSERDSVAVVSQLGPVSREFIGAYPVDHLPAYVLAKVAAGIRLVTGV